VLPAADGASVPLHRLPHFRKVFYATALYCCGVSGFLFLYNLFLIDHGYLERSIGVLASATMVGSLGGTLPVGLLARKIGNRRVMVTCLMVIGVIFALKLLSDSMIF
jgi:MFS family permease